MFAGIQPVSVLRGSQRRRCARGIFRVALRACPASTVAMSASAALGSQFQPAAARALGQAGGDEQFRVRIREDHRADVAAIQHRAVPSGEIALEREQRGAHARDGRDRGRRRIGLRAAQVGTIQVRRPQRPRRALRPSPDRRDRRRHPARAAPPRDTAGRCPGKAVRASAASRRASVPLPAAAGPSMAMIGFTVTAGRPDGGAEPVHQIDETRKTGVDEAGIVGGDRRRRDQSRARSPTWRCDDPCASRPRRRPPVACRCRGRSCRRPRFRPWRR